MQLEGYVFNHYRVLRLIGKGGMGEVYLAEDVQIQRQVAVKFIRLDILEADQGNDDTMIRLFWREARAIARLDHPNILPLLDYGEMTLDGYKLAYLILPYRPEGSLATWLRSQRPTLQQIIHLLQQAGQALQYAHDLQVMHLDVKPANFLIRNHAPGDSYPDLLLSDFGISRLVTATSNSSYHVSGTPTYMAPEQADGHPVFASDQYALAIMAYELFTGSPPFQGAPLSVMYAHAQKEPTPTRKLNPLLPPLTDVILQRALAKQAEDRFPSIAAFVQALQELEDNTSTHLRSQSVLNHSTLLSPAPSLLTPSSQFPSITQFKASQAPSITPINADQAPLVIPVTPARTAINLTPLPSNPATAIPEQPDTPTPMTARSLRKRPLWLVGGLLLSLVLLVGASVGVYATLISPRMQHASTGSGAQGAQTTITNQTSNTILASTATNTSGSPTSLTTPHTGTKTHPGSTPNAKHATPGTTPGSGGNGAGNGNNATTWSSRSSGLTDNLLGVDWTGTQFVAVGDSGALLTSPDGSTWTIQDPGPTDTMFAVANSPSLLVAVGYDGAILTSPNGVNWTSRTSGTSSNLFGITWGDSLFIATGHDGTILTSANGITWTAQHSATGQEIDAVVWNNAQFVAVGEYGTILTSANGKSWTIQSSGTTNWFNGLAWSGSLFVAVNDHGGILASPDGVNWTSHSSSTTQTLNGVTWSGSLFVAVGNAGVILTSANGVNWSMQSASTSNNLNSTASSSSFFVIVGNAGAIFSAS